MMPVLIALGVVSGITFLLYGIDKALAISGAWRIPEKVLLTAVVLGGALGGFLGMIVFRHKCNFSRKWYFYVTILLSASVHIAVVLWTMGVWAV